MDDVFEVRNRFLCDRAWAQNTWHLQHVGPSFTDPRQGAAEASAAWATRFLFEWFLQMPSTVYWADQRTRRLNNSGGPWCRTVRRVWGNPFLTRATNSAISPVIHWSYHDSTAWRTKRLYVPGVGIAGADDNRLSTTQRNVLTTIIVRSLSPFTSFGKTWQFVVWSRKDLAAYFPAHGHVNLFVGSLTQRKSDRLQPTIGT